MAYTTRSVVDDTEVDTEAGDAGEEAAADDTDTPFGAADDTEVDSEADGTASAADDTETSDA